MITLAVPKGRMLEETLSLVEELGIKFRGDIAGSRKLIHTSTNRKLRILVIRAQDVATFVERGGADLGVVGRDLLEEHSPDVYELLDLGFGYCRLVLATPKSRPLALDGRTLKIATKYQRITEAYFSYKGLEVDIIKLYGSIELAPLIGLADGIVDLVSTGGTLRANKLVEVETILESTAYLIANRSSFKTRHAEMVPFLKRLNLDVG